MGVNVCIIRQKPDGTREYHPEWDDGRMAGDRSLHKLMTVDKQIGHPYDCEFWNRPESPSAMREEMQRNYPENSDRWSQLEAILNDPEWWVYFSY